MDIGATPLPNGRTRFVVWAPLKQKMILHIIHPFDRKFQMEKDRFGYFQIEVASEQGCRYFFMPEGDKDLPDPASKFQPEGVHGPSEVVEALYQWDEGNWRGISFDNLILYEIHTGTFTTEGTFEAAIGKLDHLVETGINAIQVM